MMTRPFWESAYEDTEAASPFGETAREIRDIEPKLPAGARVLDLGCGDGRNSLFLLHRGCHVTAVDASAAAVTKLVMRADGATERLEAISSDVRRYRMADPFDLIIAHGLLHLLPPVDRRSLLRRMQRETVAGGYNVVAVFTDALPAPPDLEPFMLGLFHEGELLEAYRDWGIQLYRSYIEEDEHPGGIRHRHPINMIVAKKPR